MNSWAGTLAQFRTVFGDIEVELFDQDKPVTVKNFIRYVQSGTYSNMFIHRCDPNFVIQGGGFFVANRFTTNQSLAAINTFGTITNEFNAGRRLSNTYGTIAMARQGGLTNSATSQWFFNLTNNVFLDAIDGGFTVFGQVVSGTNVLNRFKTFKASSPTNTIFNLSLSLGGSFGELPVLTTNLTFSDLIYADISLLNVQVKLLADNAREISWNSVSNALHHVEFTTNLPPI